MAHTSAQQPKAKRNMDAADTIRLNWLDAQVKNHVIFNGFLWQEGGWESNRGLVCAIQGKKQKKTVRQAIDDAMADQANNEGEKHERNRNAFHQPNGAGDFGRA